MTRYSPKLKPYLKKLTYSYTFGAYPTLDLLTTRPEQVLKVLLQDGVEDSEGVKEIRELCKQHEIPTEINDRAISKIAYKENTHVVGIFDKYETELDPERDHLVLVEARNMGNIGTIIRTMVGFGYKNLALVGGVADVFDPKVVRSTMGALFKINFKHYPDFDSYYSEFPGHHIYPFMLENSTDIKHIAVEEPYSLVFGNEGMGLWENFELIGTPTHIPQSENIDSLNLSIAAGIAMWHFAKISKKI